MLFVHVGTLVLMGQSEKGLGLLDQAAEARASIPWHESRTRNNSSSYCSRSGVHLHSSELSGTYMWLPAESVIETLVG